MWVNDWPAGHAVAEMMAIIIQEVVGYEVEMKGPGAGTVNGFFALAGCRKPMDSQDPDCDGVTHTLVHMNVEGWTEGYIPTWQMIQDKYPSMAPRNLGNAGYFGDARAHISTPVQEMAYNAEGLSLDFYRELNASWNDVKRYFADLDSVDKSRLRSCNGTLLMDPVEMGIYAEMTGDLDGVVFEGGSVVAKCWQNHFWYAPACRQSPSRCWPFITGGSGWQVGDFMQKDETTSGDVSSLRPHCLGTWGQEDGFQANVHRHSCQPGFGRTGSKCPATPGSFQLDHQGRQ